MKLELSILIYVQYIWHQDLKHHKIHGWEEIFLPVTLSEKWKHPRYLRPMCCVRWSLQSHGEKVKKKWTRLIKPTPMISGVHFTICHYKQVPVSSRSNDADLSVQCSVHSRLLDICIYIYICLSFLVSIHNNGQYISSCINNLYSYGYVFVHVLLATFVETYVSKSVIEIVLNIPVTVLRNIIIPVWRGSTNHHSPKHWWGIRICLDDGLVLMPVANCV